MKKSLLLLSILAMVLVFSCKKIKELLRFDISYDAEFVIPSTGGVIPPILSPIFSPEVDAKTEETFNSKGTKANLVKEIRIKSVVLTISNPSGANFNFLKSISVSIADKNGNNAKKIAYKDNVPNNVTSLTLDVDGSIDLDEYIKADKFKIKSEYTLRDGIMQDYTLKAAMVFGVTADPF